jgi:uridine kinase
VARNIVKALGSRQVAIVEQDAYYKDLSHLTLPERKKINFDHPSAFDRELLISHLKALLEGGVVEVPIYDYTQHTRTQQTMQLFNKKVIIIEGILILEDPELRELLDMKLYVDTDADVRFIRRLTRDVRERGRNLDDVIHQYQTVVRPMHLQFVEPTKRYADIVIPQGGDNAVAIDLIKTKIEALLRVTTEE